MVAIRDALGKFRLFFLGDILIFELSFSSLLWTCCPLFASKSTNPNPMEVLHPRAALLANVEVLALLRELDAAHLARIRTKKDDAEDVAENLRTVELEVRPPVSYIRSSRLTCLPDNPIPRRGLSAHLATVRSWRISARPRPRPLLPHKGRETPGREPCPDRARRTLRRVSPLRSPPHRPLIIPSERSSRNSRTVLAIACMTFLASSQGPCPPPPLPRARRQRTHLPIPKRSMHAR